MAVALVATALLIIVDVEAFGIVIASVLLLLLPFVASSINDVMGVATVVDGVAGVPISLLAPLIPVPTARTQTGGSPTGRKGSVAFLVVLNGGCHHHRLDPSDNRCCRRGGVGTGVDGLPLYSLH